MLTIERGNKTARAQTGKQMKSSKSMATKFEPPTHPAIIITSAFTAPHIDKLKKKLQQHFIPYGMQTSKKKVNRPPGMPKDKNFIIADDSAGSPVLQGEFVGLSMCRVDYPKKNNLDDVIKKFDKYIGLGKQTVQQQGDFEQSAYQNRQQQQEYQKLKRQLQKKKEKEGFTALASRVQLGEVENAMQFKQKVEDIGNLFDKRSKSGVQEQYGSYLKSRKRNSGQSSNSNKLKGTANQQNKSFTSKRTLFMLLTQKQTSNYIQYLKRFKNIKNKRIMIIRSLQEYYRLCYSQKQGENCLLLSPNVAFKQLHKFRYLKNVYIYGDDPKFCAQLIKGNIKKAGVTPQQMDQILLQEGFNKNSQNQYIEPLRVGQKLKQASQQQKSKEKLSLFQRFKDLFRSKSKQPKIKKSKKPEDPKYEDNKVKDNENQDPIKVNQNGLNRKESPYQLTKKQKQAQLPLSSKDPVSLGRILVQLAMNKQQKQKSQEDQNLNYKRKITKISRKDQSKPDQQNQDPQLYKIKQNLPKQTLHQIKAKNSNKSQNKIKGKNPITTNEKFQKPKQNQKPIQIQISSQKPQQSDEQALISKKPYQNKKLKYRRCEKQQNVQKQSQSQEDLYYQNTKKPENHKQKTLNKKILKNRNVDEQRFQTKKFDPRVKQKQNTKISFKNKILKPQFVDVQESPKRQNLHQLNNNEKINKNKQNSKKNIDQKLFSFDPNFPSNQFQNCQFGKQNYKNDQRQKAYSLNQNKSQKNHQLMHTKISDPKRVTKINNGQYYNLDNPKQKQLSKESTIDPNSKYDQNAPYLEKSNANNLKNFQTQNINLHQHLHLNSNSPDFQANKYEKTPPVFVPLSNIQNQKIADYHQPRSLSQPLAIANANNTFNNFKMPLDLSKYDKIIQNGIVIYRPKFIPGLTNYPQKTLINQHIFPSPPAIPILPQNTTEVVFKSPEKTFPMSPIQRPRQIKEVTSKLYNTNMNANVNMQNKKPSFSTYEYFMNRQQLPIYTPHNDHKCQHPCQMTQKKSPYKIMNSYQIGQSSDSGECSKHGCHVCQNNKKVKTKLVHRQKQNIECNKCFRPSQKLTKTRQLYQNLQSDSQDCGVKKRKTHYMSKSAYKSKDPLSSIIENETQNWHKRPHKNYSVLYLINSKISPQIIKQLFEISDQSDTLQTFSTVEKMVEIVKKGQHIFDIIIVFINGQIVIPKQVSHVHKLCSVIYQPQIHETIINKKNIILRRIIELPQIIEDIKQNKSSKNNKNRRKGQNMSVGCIYFKDFNKPIRLMAKMLKNTYPSSQTRKYFSLNDLPTKLPNNNGQITVVLLDQVSFNEIIQYCIDHQKQNGNILLICIPKSQQSMKICQKRPGVQQVIWLTEKQLTDQQFIIKRIQRRLRQRP